MQLDRGVDHLVHHMRQINLGDRVFLGQVHALFRLVGDVQQHQPPDVELAGAFGEHELHRLAIGEQHAEGRAFRHMRGRHVEGALGFRDIVHAVAQAAVGEAVLAHIETVAFAAEQIVGRHFQVLDLDFGMAAGELVVMRAFDRHVLDVALDPVTGVRQFDDEGRILLVTRRVRIGPGHHQRHVGDAGGGGEPLLAVENIVFIAILHGGGLHAGGVGARRFFRHRETNALVAVEQRFKELFLLIRGAMREDRQHRGVVGPLCVHRERAQRAFAELHLHQRVGERAEAHAAIFLRHERAP